MAKPNIKVDVICNTKDILLKIERVQNLVYELKIAIKDLDTSTIDVEIK